MFPDYDFSKVEELGEDWYLDILPPETKDNVLRYFQDRALETLEEKQRGMLEFLSKRIVYEQPIDLRIRIAKLKKALTEYKEKYNKIAIVAHYYTIEFIKSTGFKENGNLVSYQGILNCHPYYEQLEDLLKTQ